MAIRRNMQFGQWWSISSRIVHIEIAVLARVRPTEYRSNRHQSSGNHGAKALNQDARPPARKNTSSWYKQQMSYKPAMHIEAAHIGAPAAFENTTLPTLWPYHGLEHSAPLTHNTSSATPRQSLQRPTNEHCLCSTTYSGTATSFSTAEQSPRSLGAVNIRT